MLVAVLCVVVFVRESFTPPPATAARQSVLANSRQLLAVPGLVLVMGIAFLIQYGNTVVAPILALFIHELANGINAASTAGGIMAGTGVAGALSAVVVGRLGDRLGHRRVLPVCLLGAVLVCLPQALVRSPGELFAMRLALGLFLGGLMPSANALLAGLVPAERRGSAFGLSATAVALANMIGPLSGALLASALGMRSVFVATAALYGVGLVFVLVRFRHLPSRADTVRPSMVPAHPVE
jgi:DHA1 family multidrug resistance protein-like MFS transporter